jgi:2-amino-4-hydroxy-6-hydroxymethyldihydropteridine diphosphokinase
MASALISLGSNIGDRAAALRQALALLAQDPAMRVAATSAFRETRPAGGPAAQENFLNAAALLETNLPPRDFFFRLENVEQQLGRVRTERWGSRTIDLDLLLYDQVEMETPELVLPHPRMSFRRFVLEPAAEIAAEMVYPINDWTVRELQANLDRSPKYLALGCTPYSVGARRLQTAIREAHDSIFVYQPDIQLDFVTAVGIRDEDDRAFAVHAAHLARMVKLLNVAMTSVAGQWLVSDFWFDAEARSISMILNEPQRRRLLDEWQRLRDSTQRPRLAILFESDERLFEMMLEQSQDDDVLRRYLDRFEENKRMQQGAEADFKVRCRRRDVGPTLWLPASDQERCISEVLAAIAAME